MSSLVNDWPNEKVGSNISANLRDSPWNVEVEKNSVRNEYSDETLSTRATLKLRKGVSM